MAAVNEGDLAFVSEYRKLLLLLSDQLSTEQLKKLIFLCGDHIVEGKAEKLQSALDLFKALEQQNVIGSGKVEFLIEILDQIGRQDLVSNVNDCASQTAGNISESTLPVSVMPNNRQGRNTDDTDGNEEQKREVAVDGIADGKRDFDSQTTDDVVTDGNDNKDNTAKKHPHRVALTPKSGPTGDISDAECASGRPQTPQGTRYTNFLTHAGYVVEIVGGEHFTTPDGEFVEMKSGTQYEIFVKNMHPEGCNLDISIDGIDIGGWVVDAHQEFKIERPAYDNHRFTFYRVKQAPDGSGIEKGRVENGLVECVFTPEADISVLVSTHDLLEPVRIQMPPHAKVKDAKLAAQRRLGLEEDADQPMAQDARLLQNNLQLRSCEIRSSRVLILIKSALEITIKVNTGQMFPVTVHPGREKIKDVMEKIKSHTDVPVEDQKVYQGEACLSDRPWKPLPEALVLMEDPVLAVDIPKYVQVSVRLSEKEVIPIKINKLKTLMDLQKKVPAFAAAGRKMRVWFIHEGRRLNPLEESGSLESYGLTSDSILDASFEVVLMSVVVKLPVGIETEVEVDPNGTFKDLMQEVSFISVEELKEMEFILDGTILQLRDTTTSLEDIGRYQKVDASLKSIRFHHKLKHYCQIEDKVQEWP